MHGAARNLQLVRLAQSGDRDAAEALFAENSGLIHAAARRFAGRGTDYEDLYQLGCIGMLKAIQRYDEAFGAVFTTYAVPLIIGEMKRFLRDDGTVKVSREIRQNAFALLRVRENFAAEHQREPSVQELALASGLSDEKVLAALDAALPVLSLSEPGGADRELPALENTIADSRDEAGELVEKLALHQAVEALPENERKLIELRFFRSLTQQQTAKMLGMTQVQVSRSERRILQKMRKMIV